MITQPFNFAARLTRPSTALDAAPFVNLCLLLFFFGLFGSRFVIAPGLKLDLPKTRGAALDFAPSTRVLIIGQRDGRETVLFENKVLNFELLQRELLDHPATTPDEVLLVQLELNVETHIVARVCELALQAGFGSVLIATEQERAKDAAFP